MRVCPGLHTAPGGSVVTGAVGFGDGGAGIGDGG
ncbi:hypothetical protein C8E08_3909 [Paracidovorax citrulli]|nr:hypothetical protein C8E08_3909 [Paracidovorax citrulli]REG69329.1 hypothetical protein C8E07_2477 [Paracidovorax citrulli]SDL30576.1 hypothetical protein SAMN04489709_1392 [Paracidovorax citrulli]